LTRALSVIAGAVCDAPGAVRLSDRERGIRCAWQKKSGLARRIPGCTTRPTNLMHRRSLH